MATCAVATCAVGVIARGTSSPGTRDPEVAAVGRNEWLVPGATTYERRVTGSRIVTRPSGAIAQLAPVGTPPLSPIAARAWRSAVIQFSASTVTSCRGPPASLDAPLPAAASPAPPESAPPGDDAP